MCDPDARELRRGGKVVHLTPKAFQLQEILVICSRDRDVTSPTVVNVALRWSQALEQLAPAKKS